MTERLLELSVSELSERLQRTEQSLAITEANFQEKITELEYELEERGWDRLYGSADLEFSRDALRRIARESRLFYMKNPIVKRAVDLENAYVFGQGVTIQAEQETVDAVVQSFINDELNRGELTTPRAMTFQNADLKIDGNLFLCFFRNGVGDLRVRAIPFDEIQDVISNPEDAKEPWYYLRRRIPRSSLLGEIAAAEPDKLYPDWQYTPRNRPPSYKGMAIDWDHPVYHVAVNRLSGQRFGLSEVYAAQDWARAYNEFLANWATITRSLARFAWKIVTKGGADQRALVKGKLDSGIMAGGDTYTPAPSAGSVHIETAGAADLQPIRTSGATTSPQDGRRLLLMVCAAMGFPECYSEDTEVLTDHGFILHDQWKPGMRIACYDPETGFTRWEHPTGLAEHTWSGPMVRFRNQQTDILVTPNHRMWAAREVRWNATTPHVDRSWHIVEAEKILDEPRSDGWKVRSDVHFVAQDFGQTWESPIGPVDAVAWAKFIGYFISEGSASVSTCKSGEFRKDGTPIMRDFRRISLAQKPGPVLQDMKDTLTDLGLRWTEVTCTRGVKNLVVYNKLLWTWLRDECGEGSWTKRIPQSLMESPQWTRRALYEALMSGDGGRSGGSWRYSTVSTTLADQMQLLAIGLGYGASISAETRKYRGVDRGIFRVWIRTNITTESRLRPDDVSRVWYEGNIYCFQVPTGIYVTRRNGKIAIQGNTFFGDAEVGTLATAKSLDRPTELAMLCRQRLWAEILENVCTYVIEQKARYGSVEGLSGEEILDDWDEVKWIYSDDPETGEPLNTHVAITFPDVVERSVTERVDAVVKAATMGGMGTFAGTLDAEYTTRQILIALGEKSVEEVMEQLFPAEAPTPVDVLPQVEALKAQMREFLTLLKEARVAE